MKISSEVLLNDLIRKTTSILDQAIKWKQMDLKTLNFKSDKTSWSPLECLEHLNRYGDFYLSEIRKRIENSNTKAADIFKSGWLGNYFAKSMIPKEGFKKISTFKFMNPQGSILDMDSLEKFINQQKEMLDLLERSKAVNLSKTKTSISISKWIKLKLGDTFRVVIYHNERHMLQANNAIEIAQIG